MRKFCVLLFMMIFLCGCSIQEKMNPDLFFERLSLITDDFDYENADMIYDKNNCICYIKDLNSTEYVFEFCINEFCEINKISFACNNTDKAENYIKYIKDIISVYSPKENSNEIMNEITENGKIKPSYTYYESQWYYWSSYNDKNGLYFSVINKKLSEPVTVLYSLKPNDKTGF